MAIQPATAYLKGGDSQAFTSDVPVTNWYASGGTIKTGGGMCIYTAPPKYSIWFSRQVILTAEDNNTVVGTAVISLGSTPGWVVTLGIVYLVLFIALAISVIAIWPPAPAVSSIELTPPTVTLVPNFQQQFQARIWEARDQGVAWSATDGVISPTGLFTAPQAGTNNIVITATSAADHNLTQSALLLLNPHGLVVQPAYASLTSGTSASFHIMENGASGGQPAPRSTPPQQIEWSVSDSSLVDLHTHDDGSVTLKAQTKLPDLRHIVLTASDKLDRKRQASAAIDLSSQPMPTGGEIIEYELHRDKRLLELVMLMGGLGALLGASRSLANFVGNSAFFPRWSMFYLFRPTFGAGLALLVFFGYRIGAVTGVKGAAPADPFAATFVAGMVGLFADTVLQKLKDLISALLPSQDDRKDKVSSPASAPIIESAQGSKRNNEMIVTGGNFVSGAAVTLNGHSRTAAFVSATQLRVTLDVSDQAGDVKVVVTNPDKQATAEFKGSIS